MLRPDRLVSSSATSCALMPRASIIHSYVLYTLMYWMLRLYAYGVKKKMKQGGRPKMVKKSDVRSRIRKVMADLGIENQAAFAKVLGFQPTTVSAWMTGTSLPSPDAFMALGAKARSAQDSLFFWEQAGLTKDAILSASHKLIGSGLAPAREGEVIRIRPYKPASEEDSGSTLTQPSNIVSNPASTYFWRLTEKASRRFWFSSGDIIVLDAAHTESPCVGPFFGHVVVVGDRDHSEESPLVGRLEFMIRGPRHFEATLTPVGGLATPRTSLCIADYVVPQGVSEDEASDQAFEKMQQSPALPILGRLLAYLPGEPTERIF